MTKAIRDATQVKREQGKRMASIRDWHTLRATWVTLALSANVPVEIVRRVTGHATVEVVLKHYFRPDREQFRTVLTGALPDILTGNKTIITNSNDDLSALVAKLNNGSATDDDRARFRLLAAKV